jgi:hypothetical protein
MGIILLLAITLILAALVLHLMYIPNFILQDSEVPAIFKITLVRHLNENGKQNYDSYMVVKNTGETNYKTLNLYAKTYRNGIILDSVIETMNGQNFISSHHFGVQYIVGMKGQTWNDGQSIGIDYKDKTFKPGDEVTFEVYDSITNQIISRHTYRA